MYKVVGFVLCLLVAGCPSVDEITLSAGEAQDLVDNMEIALESQQLLSMFSFEAARGDVDITGYTYDPPTAQNNWTGTLSLVGGSFPFGDGDLDITFTVMGDSGPVDPYAVDLTTDGQVTVDVVVNFLGTRNGFPLEIGADFDATTLQNDPNAVLARVNGLFGVNYDGYVADILATNVDVGIDVAQEEITSLLGDLQASVDIPDYEWDATFYVDGLGDQVQIGINVVGTTIDYVVDLVDIF